MADLADDSDNPWLTTAEAAEVIGVSTATLWRYRQGRTDADLEGPPYYRLPSGAIRYRLEDVERWLELYREAGDPLEETERGAA